MIILLSGAKKNSGDFLITSRAKALLSRCLNEEILVLPSWLPLGGHEVELQACRAIVIAGGPGYQRETYGGVYPLLPIEAMVQLAKPVVFLGLGWMADPGDAWDERHFRFDQRTLDFVERLGGLARYGSRDLTTQRVVKAAGVASSMTGCPVWYEHSRLGLPMRLPQSIERLVFTPPQASVYFDQSKQVLSDLKAAWPRAHVYCCFHRGIEADEHTPEAEAARLREYAAFAKGLGVEVRDVSYSAESMDFYAECDLHVGYRLHAHLHFLSNRLPSLCLEEDCRAHGQNTTLRLPSISAWRLQPTAGIWRRLGQTHHRRLIRGADRAAPERVRQVLTGAGETGFDCYSHVPAILDATYRVMTDFVAAI